MAFYYFDTSALVKYYITEPGSDWVRLIIDERVAETHQPLHYIFVAEITHVEVAAGLAAIERAHRIKKISARSRVSPFRQSSCPSLCHYTADNHS
jgi:predicted nucleic acid-binding protein